MDPTRKHLTALGYFNPSVAIAALAFIASFPGNGGRVCFEIAACPISFASVLYFNHKTFSVRAALQGAPTVPGMSTEAMSGALRAWVRLTKTKRKSRRA